MKRLISLLLFLSISVPAAAQWQVPVGAVPVGRGAGVVGFNSVSGANGLCLVSTGPTTAPTFQSCTSNPLIIPSGTPTTSGALGYSTSINFGDGAANHLLLGADLTQTVTNKTINCANNTCTVRIGSDVTGLGTGVAASLANPFVTRAANPTNLYVATTGNDSNTCLLVGSPCLTLQRAVNTALQNYDSQGSNITINIGTGTFAGAQVSGPMPGGGGASALTILGNGAANTLVNTTVIASGYANIKIGSFKIAVASGPDLLVANNSIITLADGGMNFGAAVTAIVQLTQGSAFYGSGTFGFTISGAASAAFLIQTNSNVQLSAGGTYTITGTPNFPNGFVNAINGSGFNPGITSVFSGSATGPTYNMSINSWIDMEQNVNPLPGNAAGVLQYGSSYYGSPTASAIGVGPNLLTVNGGTGITPASSGLALWNAGTITTTAAPLYLATAPVATTFCTSPSIPANNGTGAFTINVGTGCATSVGTITMPAATTGWVCDFHNITNFAANKPDQSGGTTTTVALTNFSRTTGAATNWTSSDVIRAQCSGY